MHIIDENKSITIMKRKQQTQKNGGKDLIRIIQEPFNLCLYNQNIPDI